MSNTQITQDQKVEFRFRERDGYKRPTLELTVPLLTLQGVAAGIATDQDGNPVDPKVATLVVDTVNGPLIAYIRSAINADENFSQETLDEMVAKGEISLTHLANLPRSERNVTTNADLAAFAKAFVEVAAEVEHTEQRIASVNGAQVAAQAFVDRIKAAAGKNEILDKLTEMLEKFAEAASEELIAEHAATIEWLFTKLSEARKVEELSMEALD